MIDDIMRYTNFFYAPYKIKQCVKKYKIFQLERPNCAENIDPIT